MFSVITIIYNKKTKGPTLVELFIATGKLKKYFFFDNERYSMFASRVTRHTSIRYSSSCYTHASTLVHRYSSLLQWSVPLGQLGHVGGSLAYFARNSPCSITTDLLVWYSNTRNDFSSGAAIFSLHTLASPRGRNVNYDEKQLTEKKI